MMKGFSRRAFLESSALVAGGSLLKPAANAINIEPQVYAAPGGANDRVRFAMVGVGMEGSSLLRSALQLPGVECVGAADLYDGRHLLARQITKNPNLPVTRNYKELLDRKDIDCVIVAVPDFWHETVFTDVCNSGKDVYCEKPMSHTVAEGFQMVEAAKKNNRIAMIGVQRVSSSLSRKAKEMYDQGLIGDVTMVELSLGRNSPTGAWEYPPPPGLSLENLAWDVWLKNTPKIPLNPIKFAGWRAFSVYGTGMAGDLMVHLLTNMSYVLGWNDVPRSALALGGIYRWKDGRDEPDLQPVLFDYHGVPVYMRLGLSTRTPETADYMGPKGILHTTEFGFEFEPQTGKDLAPSYYDQSFPQKMRETYERQWNEKNSPPPGQELMVRNQVFTGHDWDDLRPHLWTFFQSVKSRQPVYENPTVGNAAAIACHMANMSYFKKSRVFWHPDTQTVETSA